MNLLPSVGFLRAEGLTLFHPKLAYNGKIHSTNSSLPLYSSILSESGSHFTTSDLIN